MSPAQSPTLRRGIPPDLLEVQAETSDPAVSAWVAANAGSGKTHVLAQRVIRLLLEGTEPSKILCITFTKAAAANMANRVFDELRRWTTLDDRELDGAIATLSGLPPDGERRARARRLFAFSLETPGGLKVQTIHAFCTRLLQQFPFEANVAARFEVLDDTGQTRLLDEISLGVLLEAAQLPDSALGRALATAVATAADQTFKEVVSEAIRKRNIVHGWVLRSGSIDAAVASLCGMLELERDDCLERVEREITHGPLLPAGQWHLLAKTLAQGSAKDQEQARRLTAALHSGGSERTNIYLQIFLTQQLKPRQHPVSTKLESIDAGIVDRFCRERERLLPLVQRRKALVCRDRTAALIAIADAVISRYQQVKDRRGLLDYDDLIDKAVDLLSENRAAWVHYKLDQGIDHVLIDEAQDTSTRQWEIIRRLTEEFFAGEGARGVQRTVFAVGDEKQSIFSFQNAAPRAFAQMRRHFQRAHEMSGLPFIHRDFKHSFRSGANVLGAVDKVFEPRDIYQSVTSDSAGVPAHIALPDAAPGLVELWDTTKPQEKRQIDAWDAPFDAPNETSPQVRLAAKIARHVKRWNAQGTRAGDVLILVRQRGPLFEAIIRALKDRRLPVAGADRLMLAEHIAVMDLMALADALLLADDDLALASVLKSPLFGLDDGDLFAIAWQRAGSLRNSLRSKAASDFRLGEASEKLERLAHAARRELPFAFYARVLGAEGGRKAFLQRLGHEADDAIDEFLNLALDYERRETPSLQGFVAWLRTAQAEVKRDMEITRDEVRVMTVHGAKGLEARVVVLADTVTPPAGLPQRQPRLLTLGEENGEPTHVVWPLGKIHDVPPVSAARDRQRQEAENEYRRLLYVAMTRAIERLIVCGAEGERGPPPGCWWNLLADALRPLSVQEPADDGDGMVWRYRKVPQPAIVAATADTRGETVNGGERPSWLERKALPAIPSAVPLSPSHAHDEVAAVRRTPGGSRGEREKAMARGVILHRMLQSLPDIAPAVREAAARAHVARTAVHFSAEERVAMVEQVLKLLNDARFAALFAPGSRSEVAIVSRVVVNGRSFAVSGQVDRLAVASDSILIADYKTNRPAPRLIEQVPPAYFAQLALYRAALAGMYPHKGVRAALLWTEIPELMEVPASIMDAAFAAVTST
jgi:ATP-dependent helicase/nuclease subunit A